MPSSDTAKFHDALKSMGTGYSALSWSGFNVFGDEASIKEVSRLMHLEHRTQCLEREVEELRCR